MELCELSQTSLPLRLKKHLSYPIYMNYLYLIYITEDLVNFLLTFVHSLSDFWMSRHLSEFYPNVLSQLSEAVSKLKAGLFYDCLFRRHNS